MAKKNGKATQNELRESANKVWLAGLGALATASEEGGKLFDQLVKKGQAFEPKVMSQVDKAKDKFDEAKGKAEKAWTKLEGNIDHRVTAAIHRIGVPTRDEIKELSKRVAELTSKVEDLKPRTARARTTR
jgi:poly(hydroxyalkanoate) granule-associated protein